MKLRFGGADEVRPDVEIDAAEFIAVKSFKAKGKRLTHFTLAEIEDITPEPEPTAVPESVDDAGQDDAGRLTDIPAYNETESDQPSLFDFAD